MTYKSTNHNYLIPDDGQEPRLEGGQWVTWGDDLQDTLETLDRDVVIKGTKANRPAAGTSNRWYLATDTLELFYDDGSTWNDILAEVGNADTLDNYDSTAFGVLAEAETVTGGWTHDGYTQFHHSTEPTPGTGGAGPVAVRAASNVAMNLYAAANSGTENMNIAFHKSDGTFMGALDGHAQDSSPHISIYYVDDNLATGTPTQQKALTIFGGSANQTTRWENVHRFLIEAGPGAHADMRLVPDTGNDSQIHFVDAAKALHWELQRNGANGNFELYSHDAAAFAMQIGTDAVANFPTGLQQGGNNVLTTADEGTLDAGTLDGRDSTAFAARGDNETISGEWEIQDATDFRLGTDADFAWWFDGAGTSPADTLKLTEGPTTTSPRDVFEAAVGGTPNFPAGLNVGGSRALTTADEGTLDAGTVDGYDSAAFAARNENESIGGNWTVEDNTDFRLGTDADVAWWFDGAGTTPADTLKLTEGPTTTSPRDLFEASVGGTPNFPAGVQSGGSSVLTTADEGTLDAGTLDGQDSTAFETKEAEFTGTVTLSSGVGVVDTGVTSTTAAFEVSLGVQDPAADCKVSAVAFWDDTAGTHKVEVSEVDTTVGNPTVNYAIRQTLA